MSQTIISTFAGQHHFLSNFYPCRPFSIWLHYGFCGQYDHWFPTVEHAYQASKFNNNIKRDLLRACPDGKDVKKLAFKLSLDGSVRDDWKQVNVLIMTALVRDKFRDPLLRSLLLRTGEARLVEGNYWHDNFWGDCWCGYSRCSGVGQNELGRILELVRWEVQNVWG